MKIKLLKSFPGVGPGLQRETVVEARISPSDDRIYQITSGNFCGFEVYQQHAMILPDERLYTESELESVLSELNRELIQKREEVAVLMEANRLLQEQAEREKVALPRDVAEAIEFLHNEKYSNYGIITYAHNIGLRECWLGHDKALQSVREFFQDDPDQLLSAFVNGYTIEPIPEEKMNNKRCELCQK